MKFYTDDEIKKLIETPKRITVRPQKQNIAKEANIREGLKEDRDAFITGEYSTFEDALIFFLKKCNIINAGDHFELDRFQSLAEGND